MGKYDKLFKHLGKESEVDPQVVQKDLERMEAEEMTVNEDEVSDEAMANVDALLDSFGAEDADLDDLSEIPIEQSSEAETDSGTEDAESADDDFDLSEFAVDTSGGDEDLSEDLSSAMEGAGEEMDDDFLSAFEDSDAMSPETPETPEEPTPEAEPPQETPDSTEQTEAPTEEDTAEVVDGIDQEVLDELDNLDSSPPSLDDIQRKAEGKEKDLIQEMMEEEQEGEEDAFNMDDVEIEEEAGGMQFPDESENIEEIPPEMETDTSEVSDLLSQLSSEQEETPTETPATEEPMDFDLEEGGGEEMELPGADEEMDDLESLLSSDMDLGGTEDLSMDQFQDEEPVSAEESPSPEEEPGAGSDLTELMEPSPGITPGGGAPVADGAGEVEDMGGLEDLMETPDMTSALPEEEAETEIESPDEDFGLEALDEFAESEDFDDADDFEPSLDEDLEPSADILDGAEESSSANELPDIEMDEDKAVKIRNRINKIKDPEVRKIARKALLDSPLSPELMEQYIAKLLLNESDEDITEFLDEHMPVEEEFEEIEEEEEPKKPGAPMVIWTDEARRAKDFQKELANITKYVGVLFVVVIVLGILFFRFIWKPAMAARHYENGLEAMSEGNYELTENYFLKGLGVSGTNHGWFVEYAESYLDYEEEDRAIDKYTGSLASDPDNQQTIFSYGEYLTEKDDPDYEQAVELYQRVVENKPDDFEVVDTLGMAYIDWADIADDPEDKYEEAVRVYTDYIVDNARHVDSYMRLLLVAIRQDNLVKVNTLYDTIKEIDEKAIHPEIFTELSEYYIDNRETERAREVMEKTVTYAQRHLKSRNRKKAATDEDKELYAETFYQYGRFLTLTMDYSTARNSLSNTIMLEPDHAEAFNLMGELFYITEIITNNTERAREYFETSIEKDSGYWKPYVNLGHLYYYEKLYVANADTDLAQAKSLQYYELAEAYLPDEPVDDASLLHYNLGWLYYQNENYQSAFDQWYPLYMDEPFNPVLSQAMGNTFYHLSQTNLAQSEYEKAIEYYKELADGIGYINSTLDRHQEIFMQLARSYNNRGVLYVMKARANPSQVSFYEEMASLDFYRAKNAADQVDQTYEHAENNIKYLLNQTGFGNRPPSFDDTIPQKTTLQRWLDEFREKLILNI